MVAKAEPFSNFVRYCTEWFANGVLIYIEHLAVLIVDDEVLIWMKAVEMLSSVAAVFEAGDTAEALALLAAHREIALVLTDINMPGDMDGTALVANVHPTRPAIQWIVTSDRVRLSDGELPGHATFQPKPYRQAEPVDAVTEKLLAIA